MAKKSHPKLANRFLLKLARTFVGKRYFKRCGLTADFDLSKLKPPYVVVANHCGLADIAGVTMLTAPNCGSFIVSETQIAQRSPLIKYVGVLPKKQFTVDISLIRDIKYVLGHKRPVIVFPEAKLSVDGRLCIVKPATAKLIKMLKVPLVTICFNGAYISKPRWASSRRIVPITANIKVLTADEINKLTAEQINNYIVENLTYDDYAYQRQNNISIDVPDLCEGLETILYKCPVCGEEFAMVGKGNTLTCNKCGATVTQNKFGELVGGKFGSVTDWYDWQRDCVTQELSNGNYVFDEVYLAQKLVGRKYVDLGEARLVHNGNGITVTLRDGELHFPVGAFYTLSFNTEYVFLPTQQAVYRFARTTKLGSNTKLNIAVEQQTILAGK